MLPFSKTYCINLNQDINKLNYFNKELSKTKLITSYNRFDAVNGYNIDLSKIEPDTITDYARSCVLSKRQKTFGITLTFGSLGCALSHKQIFTECRDDTKPFLIFEDDIIIESNFDQILQLLLNKLTLINYDIIYLGYNEIPGFKKNKIDDILSKPEGLITGLYGYIISPSGANKLLQTIFPLNKQIDSSISDNSKKLNLFCTTNRIIGVTHKFGSKTQKQQSCKNIFNMDDWDKLFQKVY